MIGNNYCNNRPNYLEYVYGQHKLIIEEMIKVFNIKIYKSINFLTLLLIKESKEFTTDLNIFQELFLFLARYVFIVDIKSSESENLKRQNPSHGELFFKNSNGARYLDPKYSRWISVDPALGEYMNETKEGEGGILNSINLNLYHYSGHNPVKYIDPDGRIYKNEFEAIFVEQVLGEEGLAVYYCSNFLPWAPEDCGISLPILLFMFIAYDKATYDNPILNNKNTFIHEIFYQIQYFSDPKAFVKLVGEFFLDEQMAKKGRLIGYETHYLQDNGGMYTTPVYDGNTVSRYVYQYEKFNLTKYKTLSDLPFYESQAQFVGDYAELYFDARFGGGLHTYNQYILKQMARIMKNSGYEETEAVKWIESNIK